MHEVYNNGKVDDERVWWAPSKLILIVSQRMTGQWAFRGKDYHQGVTDIDAPFWLFELATICHMHTTRLPPARHIGASAEAPVMLTLIIRFISLHGWLNFTILYASVWVEHLSRRWRLPSLPQYRQLPLGLPPPQKAMPGTYTPFVCMMPWENYQVLSRHIFYTA